MIHGPNMHHDDMKYAGLPDPQAQPDFYEGVPTKRLVAFVIDLLISGILAAMLLPFTAFLGLFFFPVFVAIVSFVYRVLTIASGSATIGMRFMGIELRTKNGERFDLGLALLHTGMFYAWSLFGIVQIVSAAMMLLTPRKQSLSDVILGSAAINRPSLF